MISYRSLALIIILCVAFIGLAMVVKISQSLPRTAPISAQAIASQSTLAPVARRVAPAIAPEPSFFDNTSAALVGGVSGIVTRAVPQAVSPLGAVTARAYLVGNIETGQIYLERGGSLVLPVASMSKLVTAVAATDTLAPTDIV